MLSLLPWWKSMVNSSSPNSRARAPVELKAPAAKAEMETVSSARLAPVAARSWPLRSMSRASVAPDSPRKVVRTALIFSASPSWMTTSCSLTVLPLFLTELANQDHPGDGIESVEHPVAVDGHGLEGRDPPGPPVQQELHVLEGRDVAEVPLVVLDHVGHLVQAGIVLAEVLFQVAEALDVLARPIPLQVGHKDHPVRASQHQLARHVLVHLPGHRVELELGREAPHGQRGDGQEVEKKRPVVTGRERDHRALAPVRQALVDVLEVGGLPGQSRPVVDHLEGDD